MFRLSGELADVVLGERGEVFHQHPMDEDIAATDLPQKEPVGRIIEEVDILPGAIIIPPD